MRLPFTLSELSVIRSGGRVFVQLLGVIGVLLGLWAATVIIDKSMESADEALVSESGEFMPQLTFPVDAELTHRDGRRMTAMLVNRPSQNEVTVQRKSDGRTFILDLKILSDESADYVRKFVYQGSNNSVQSLINQFQGHLALPTSTFDFPHRCTLVSTEGMALQATLLHRENPESIRFRRIKDGRIFTISLDRLIESDRQLIRQFPVGYPEIFTYDFEDG